ncbi:unnamed protein product, partial [Rotaria magnacalcarata]
SIFGGIFIPTSTTDYNSLFFTEDQFVRSTLTLTTLNIVTSETPYYVKNLQEPIAKSSEIVFQNLLFTTVCLELFGLIFLLFKLLLKPMHYYIQSKSSTYLETNINNKQHNTCSTYQDKISGNNDADINETAYF